VAINVIAAKLFPPRNDQVEPFAAAEQEVSA
jgi:hypothetical protein